MSYYTHRPCPICGMRTDCNEYYGSAECKVRDREQYDEDCEDDRKWAELERATRERWITAWASEKNSA